MKSNDATDNDGMIRLTIDNKPVAAEDGVTILDAARRVGIDIPAICHHDGVEPCVSCFICVVKIDGRENFVPSCSTMVMDGMVVDTCSEEVAECRRRALDLMLSVHAGECEAACMKGRRDPAQCKIGGKAKCFKCACEEKSSCKLRQYALQYGASFYSYKNSGNYAKTVYDSGLVHEPGKCIVCGKCIAITRARNIKPGLAFCGRGADVKVVAPFGVRLDEAMEEATAECVEACPTRAIRK